MSFSSLIVSPEELYNRELQNRRFTQEDVSALGLKLLTKDETKELLGHTREEAIKIPYFDFNRQETGFARVRILVPKTKMKYSQRRSSGAHIYFPPTIAWQSYLKDATKPLIITEGEFKSYEIVKAVSKEGLTHAAIGLAGVTSWTSKNSETPLHEELMEIQWQNKRGHDIIHRKVYILFDYDGKEDFGEPNEQVAIAEARLAATLRGLGAEVYLCRIGKYAGLHQGKYAIDDHLHAGKNLADVLAGAEQLSNKDVKDLRTELYEFRTQYAFFNGDVIRLSDGHGFSYAKAKIDAGHLRYEFLDEKGKVKYKELLDEYKAWPKKLNLKDVGMFPEYQGYTITPDGAYNYLRDWEYTPMEGDVAPYLDFCKYFFTDLPEFELFFHDWVAQIIQKPWEKNFTSIIFASNLEGVGKSALAEFIAALMGVGKNKPAGICGPDEIFKEKNEVLNGKLLVVVNEPSSDRDDHNKTLKHLITSDFINIDNKYGLKYTTRNYVNLILTTNAAYVTKMSKNSRRDAIYSPNTLTREDGYLKTNQLLDWAKKDNGYAKVLNWYLCRDITDYQHSAPAPKSKHKDAAVLASQTSIEDFADELYEMLDTELGGIAAFRPVQLELLAESLTGVKNVRAKSIFHAFSRIGEVDMNARTKIDGIVMRYHIYRTKKFGDKMGGDKILEVVKRTQEMINKYLKVG
jgi:hypothetical protein